jgi:tetratricopeptide (TPR) repeat protein
MWRRIAGDGWEVAGSLGYLSEALLHQGKFAEAEVQRREEWEMMKRLDGSENAGTAVSLCRLADVLQREDKLEEAEDLGKKALAISRKLPAAGGDSVMAVAESLDILVSILVARNKNVEADQLLAEMLQANPEGQPLRGSVLRVRASCFGRCRRWKETIADLTKLVELDGSDVDSAFRLSILHLEMADKENHRAQCQKMLKGFSAANSTEPLSKTAEACLLSSEAGSGFEAAGAMADQAFKVGRHSFLAANLEFIKGLAEYRAGRFAEAINWANKSIGQPTMVSGPRPDAAAYSVIAMAQHQMKRPEEARAALAKGAETVNAKLLNLGNAPLDENWVDWLIAHILLREAQALIERIN